LKTKTGPNRLSCRHLDPSMHVDDARRKRSPRTSYEIVSRCEPDTHDHQQQNDDKEEELPVVLAPGQALRHIG